MKKIILSLLTVPFLTPAFSATEIDGYAITPVQFTQVTVKENSFRG